MCTTVALFRVVVVKCVYIARSCFDPLSMRCIRKTKEVHKDVAIHIQTTYMIRKNVLPNSNTLVIQGTS